MTGDALLGFAHVAWAPDSSRVGVLVVNPLRGGIEVGYDKGKSAMLPFSSVADLMRRSITDTYSLRATDLQRYGGDPLRWAKESEHARDMFRKQLGRN